MIGETTVGGVTVSRETFETLKGFESLVQRWNPSINLVSKATLADLWGRHIVDSAQIFAFCPETARKWVDIGSGGGFPGIVIAILARERSPALEVVLVESDRRKAVFLQQVVRELGLVATIACGRAEALAPLEADVLSARALAPLKDLLGLARRHLRPEGVALFPKGGRFREELAEARQNWLFEAVVHGSVTDPEAAILEIRKVDLA